MVSGTGGTPPINPGGGGGAADAAAIAAAAAAAAAATPRGAQGGVGLQQQQQAGGGGAPIPPAATAQQTNQQPRGTPAQQVPAGGGHQVPLQPQAAMQGQVAAQRLAALDDQIYREQQMAARRAEVAARKLVSLQREMDRITAKVAGLVMERQALEEGDDGIQPNETKLSRAKKEADVLMEQVQKVVSEARNHIFEAEMSPVDEEVFLNRVSDVSRGAEHNHVSILLRVEPILLEKKKQEEKDLQAAKSVNFEKLAPPTFSGKYTEYTGWRARWKAGIEQAPIPTVQKLQHLKNKVHGQARSMILPLGDSEADYERAWKVLDARYGDKGMQSAGLRTYIQQMDKPSNDTLKQREYHDEVQGLWRKLLQIEPGVTDDKTIQQCIQGHYSLWLDRKIKENLGTVEVPMEQYFEEAEKAIALDIHCRNHQVSGAGEKSKASKGSTGSPGGKKGDGSGAAKGKKKGSGGASRAFISKDGKMPARKSGKQGKSPPTRGSLKKKGKSPGGGGGQQKSGGAAGGAAQASEKRCHLCGKNDHYISGCKKFLDLSVHERLSRTQNLGLCFRCLRRGHKGSDCQFARPCQEKGDNGGDQCKRTDHHRLLHRPPRSQ